MQQVIVSRGIVPGSRMSEQQDSQAHGEEDLGFAAAMRFAVPVGIALWAIAIWVLTQIL